MHQNIMKQDVNPNGVMIFIHAWSDFSYGCILNQVIYYKVEFKLN